MTIFALAAAYGCAGLIAMYAVTQTDAVNDEAALLLTFFFWPIMAVVICMAALVRAPVVFFRWLGGEVEESTLREPPSPDRT